MCPPGKSPAGSPTVRAETWEWLRNLSAWSPLLTPPHLPSPLLPQGPQRVPGLPPASYRLPFLGPLLQVRGFPCLMLGEIADLPSGLRVPR